MRGFRAARPFKKGSLMNCEKVRADLTALWDNELPESTGRRMRGHLVGCPGCRAAWDAIHGLHQALRQESLPPVPQDLAARISAAGCRRIKEREAAPRRRFAFPMVRPAFALKAVALAALLALGFLMGASSPPPAVASNRPADNLEIFDLLPPQTPAGAIVGVMEEPEARP